MFKKAFSFALAFSLSAAMFCTAALTGYAEGEDQSAEPVVPNPEYITAKHYEDIVFDGKVDGAWSAVEGIELKSFGDSKTTATVKTVYTDKSPLTPESTDHKTLIVLVEIDKHGVDVTDKDSAWIAVNLYHDGMDSRYGESFGLGLFSATCFGMGGNQQGWYSVYRTADFKAISKRTATDKWVCEFAVNIVGATDPGRKYEMAGGEKGFGIGTEIGFDVLVEDEDKQYILIPDSKGATWTSTDEPTFALATNRIIIGGELEYTPPTYGDVNGDGKVKGNDSTLLLKYLAGWDVTINVANADCDGNGEVKGKDSTLLLKYLAGWNVTLG